MGVLSDRVGIVKLRQFADQLRHRLSFVPALYVVGSIAISQLLLLVDRKLVDTDLPQFVTTTVDSARSLFTAIAGGLITSITLLLSMMLVTIQLASSQYSPRILREWLSDRWLQHTIGLTLGTTVFCLLALRSTRSFGDGGGEVVPHTTVLMAVALGVVSLFAVVRTVDHITHSLRIGAIAKRIAQETVDVIRAQNDELSRNVVSGLPAIPSSSPSTGVRPDEQLDNLPGDAVAIEAPTAGWVQQIDTGTVLRTLPPGSAAFVVVPLGGYVPARSPIMWVSPPPNSDEAAHNLLDAFALGDSRTMQQDVAFGLLQLTDIAVRALSPGINDPGTANDVVVHLGNVVIELWSFPQSSLRLSDGDRSVTTRRPDHEEFLRRAFDPIRRYGAADPYVMATLLRTLHTVRSEVIRRELVGPVDPIERMITSLPPTTDRTTWTALESDEVDSLAVVDLAS